MDKLKRCVLCPRRCFTNRYKNKGLCGADDKLVVAYYSLHMWEEPIISGVNGSGTIFFSNCSMKCLYCQNKKISLEGYGKVITIEKLSDIMMELQEKGAHNINFVTPTHYSYHIIEAIKLVKDKLHIPIVYNTSGYENDYSIDEINEYVDIYLTDFRYFDDELAFKYSFINNYVDTCKKALDFMFKSKNNIIIEDGIMKSGIIVRVLIIPGHIDDSKKIIKYLYDKYKDNIIISIMNQYTPVNYTKYSNLNRKLSEEEYMEVVNYAEEIGVENAFIQVGDTQDESFIPPFNVEVFNK